MTSFKLVSPLAGWVSPLEEVPDAVFSGKLMGDGVALDPVEGCLHAPCDGVVAMSARHAVTIRADNGAEILVHIGLETVALNGEGFSPAPAEGARVKAGEVLFRFDLEVLGAKAKSLISPVVVANSDRFCVRRCVTGREVAVGDALMEVVATDALSPGDPEPETVVAASRTVRVTAPHGIHARPAARIAALSKTFTCRLALVRDGQRADARSPTALMTLGVVCNDEVRIEAAGGDGDAAISALAELIESGMGEAPEAAAKPGAAPGNAVPSADIRPVSADADLLTGICAVSGLVIGQTVQYRSADPVVTEAGCGAAAESAALDRAIAAARDAIGAAASVGGTQREILQAHASLLEDPDLRQSAEKLIAQGKSAAFAWRGAVRAVTSALERLNDSRLRERVADLLDIERQVLTTLNGAAPAALDLPGDAILLAEDLLPTQLMALDRSRLKGLVLARGGATSHVAILAAGMALPTLVGAGGGVTALEEGGEVLLDAGAGRLYAKPDADMLKRARAAMAAEDARRAEAQALATRDAQTADGVRIEVFANLGGKAGEAAAAVAGGAEGCGLLRTEFLFMERDAAPDAEEQRTAYQKIADALAGRPFVLRLLDVGADKPAPYLAFPQEVNPVLGLRGLRAGLRWPELLRSQLQAAMQVTPACRIMLPMVIEAEEIRAVRAIMDEIRDRTGGPACPLGIMIETPAAAMTADTLAGEVDFFSVGTNDLTQYTLAIDRTHPDLAGRLDALHPAVLRLIGQAASAASAAGKPIGVCGGLGADPLGPPVLVGLGITELSVPPSAVAAVKARIRGLSLPACRDMAGAALACASAAEVRTLLGDRLRSDGKDRV